MASTLSPRGGGGDGGGGGDATSSASSNLSSYLSDRAPGLVFSGWYADRVWVESVGAFRDRVRADPEETEAGRILRGVARRARKEEKAGLFACVEKSGDCWQLLLDWSRRDQSPFGHYWFFVEGVRQGRKSLEWDVRILRPVLQGDSHSGKCPHCGKLPHQDPDKGKGDGGKDAEDDPLSLSDIANNLQRSFRDAVRPGEILAEIKPHLTLANLINAFRFLLVLLMAVVSGAANLLPKMLQLLNRTLHEGGFFLRQAMPFLLACVEVVNKIFGGIFLLVAMVWRDLRSGGGGSPAETPPPALGLSNRSAAAAGAGTGAAYQRRFDGGGITYPYRRENVQRPYFSSSRRE